MCGNIQCKGGTCRNFLTLATTTLICMVNYLLQRLNRGWEMAKLNGALCYLYLFGEWDFSVWITSIVSTSHIAIVKSKYDCALVNWYFAHYRQVMMGVM